MQVVTVEGPDGMLYVASRPVSRPRPVTVNTDVLFAIERDRLYTKAAGADAKADARNEFWFRIVRRVRLPQ